MSSLATGSPPHPPRAVSLRIVGALPPDPPQIDDPAARPLSVLRALIDSVDHEVLKLRARRDGLVGEFAAYKRAHGVAIRDRRREREIIADRRRRAGSLGLSPEVVESMLRLIL